MEVASHMNVEKTLQKSRVGAAWAAIPEEAARRAAAERFAALLAENDLSNKMLARHLTNASSEGRAGRSSGCFCRLRCWRRLCMLHWSTRRDLEVVCKTGFCV